MPTCQLVKNICTKTINMRGLKEVTNAIGLKVEFDVSSDWL